MMTRLLTAGLVACAFASAAEAAPTRVKASQDQSVESSFSLNFGEAQGGVSSASITRTDLELEIDGISGTAKFVNYDQDVDALILPGGLSTGAIRVQIVPGSSTGTFNRATGEFITEELYNIEFDGDLSAMGLFSPVQLPSRSVGIVDLASSTVGRVTMNWAGNSQDNPAIPFDFSYICTLFASFSVNAASYVEVEMAQMVSTVPMTEALRTTLFGYLNTAIASLNDGNTRAAVNALRTFIIKVRMAGGNVAQSDAADLIAAANYAIHLAENPLTQVLNRLGGTGKSTSRNVE